MPMISATTATTIIISTIATVCIGDNEAVITLAAKRYPRDEVNMVRR